jgi:hypothetical protein
MTTPAPNPTRLRSEIVVTTPMHGGVSEMPRPGHGPLASRHGTLSGAGL